MGQLTKIEGAALASPQPEGFDFTHLRVFNTVPANGYDAALLRGMVVVYDRDIIGREGVQIGQLYVRESQHAPSAMNWARWLDMEREGAERRGRPYSPLTTRREVVQAIEHPGTGLCAFRLDSGFIDGPIHQWAMGFNLVGKVAGVYLPKCTEA